MIVNKITTTMDEVMEIDGNTHVSNEEYLITRARDALKVDPYAAKAWMLTAQTLFPRKFGIQFEAYKIEKSTNNVKEASKCFAALVSAFPNEKELRAEIQMMTTALKKFEESDGTIESAEYLVCLFYQLPQSVQEELLLNCARTCIDCLEHAKLMLLYFRKFPSKVIDYGPHVMENLITAEKQRSISSYPVNSYRKVLVCDLLPLLGQHKVEINQKILLHVFDKTVEFYLVYIFEPSRRGRREDGEVVVIEDPWNKLWEIILTITVKLDWPVANTIFRSYWNRDNYIKAVTSMFHERADPFTQKQIAFSATLILMRCVHEYGNLLDSNGNGEPSFVLVQAFCSNDITIPPKPGEDLSAPDITAGVGAPPALIHTYVSAVRCLELLHKTEIIHMEYRKLRSILQLDPWLKTFFTDASIYRGNHQETFLAIQSRLEDPTRLIPIIPSIGLLSCYYWMSNYGGLVDTIGRIADLLHTVSVVGVSSALTVVTRQLRHLHYLPVTRSAILNYCVKLLLRALKPITSDLALGHTLVLIQLNWPAESELLEEVTKTIRIKRQFEYQKFTQYIIKDAILEEFAFLSNDAGLKVKLDIFPEGQQAHSQRRMSTRGVDKGVKEDFRMAIRGQISRSNEPIDELIMRFLTYETHSIHASLLNNYG